MPLRATSNYSWDTLPVRAGMQIARPTSDPTKSEACTLGFSALRDGVDAFITNAHCTYELWAADGTPFYQPLPPLLGNYIGAELDDPGAARTCRKGSLYYLCRYSDAVLVEYADDVDFAVGRIARTTWRSTNPTQSGSTTIDPADPYFEVFWVDKYPSHGETVHKMGVTTGWTSGTVVSTCETALWVVMALACQYRATYASAGGDSGAPVFKWDGVTRPPDPPLRENGSGATLTGIHWGRRDASSAWFSPLGGVEKDLGQLDVLWEGFSATISGPMILEPGETGTWWGSASGGTSPYSYEWSGVLSGTGSSITGELWSSGTLDLTVTDADGTEASTHILVCVLQDEDDSEDDSDVCPI